jgi:hypothetical protein
MLQNPSLYTEKSLDLGECLMIMLLRGEELGMDAELHVAGEEPCIAIRVIMDNCAGKIAPFMASLGHGQENMYVFDKLFADLLALP